MPVSNSSRNASLNYLGNLGKYSEAIEGFSAPNSLGQFKLYLAILTQSFHTAHITLQTSAKENMVLGKETGSCIARVKEFITAQKRERAPPLP